MSERFYPIVLQKSEWNRLKKQGSSFQLEENLEERKKEYIDALNEQSQEWIKHWPDSGEGHKAKLEENRRKRREDNKALVETYRKLKKTDNSQKQVQRAKQMIFDSSCYGRQLISAICESMAQDEREIQIKFKKEIELKEEECEKNKKYGVNPLDFDETIQIARRKIFALECVKYNKEVVKKKKDEKADLEAQEKVCDIVDEDMIKQLQEAKAKIKAETKRILKQELEEYGALNKDIEKRRKLSKKHDDCLINVCKKDQDRLKCRIDAVLKQAIEEQRSGKRAVKAYKMIEELQNAQQKKLDNFIENSVKKYEERYIENNEKYAKQEEKDNESESKKRTELRRIAEENKLAGENYKRQMKLTAPVTKCACDVQTLLVKPEEEKTLKKLENSNKKPEKSQANQAKLSFLKPCSKLREALQERATLPSGYTAAAGSDKYFSQQATEAIAKCSHKSFAKKVVDEYLKVNNLKSSDLTIPNY